MLLHHRSRHAYGTQTENTPQLIKGDLHMPLSMRPKMVENIAALPPMLNAGLLGACLNLYSLGFLQVGASSPTSSQTVMPTVTSVQCGYLPITNASMSC